MRSVFYWVFYGIFVFTFCSYTIVWADSFSSGNQWKEILAIGEEKDYTIGADLTLSIEPDQYYCTPSDEIVLSGSLKGIFGPLSGKEITIERTNSSNVSISLKSVTDISGIYALSDILSEPGIYRYQALYIPEDENSDTPLKSITREIFITSSKESADDLNTSLKSMPKEDDSVVSLLAEQNNSVHLSSQGSEFTPGEQVFFSGNVSSQDRPVAYAPVYIQPEIQGVSKAGNMIPYQTKNDGTVNVSYHLTGPDPLLFSLIWQKSSIQPKVQSEPVLLMPSGEGINPPTRIVHDTKTLDAYLEHASVVSLHNFTIYGWYCGKDGLPQVLSPLDLVWYNFGERIWDQYQNSSQILTNADGLFECTVPAPQTPGTYLLAVKTRESSQSKEVYSNVLPLTVIPAGEESSENIDPELPDSVLPVSSQILITVSSVPARVSEEITLFIKTEGMTDDELQHSGMQVFYSENGIDWDVYTEINPPIPIEDTVVTFTPENPGYHYFRASLSSRTGVITSSPAIVIPVIE